MRIESNTLIWNARMGLLNVYTSYIAVLQLCRYTDSKNGLATAVIVDLSRQTPTNIWRIRK